MSGARPTLEVLEGGTPARSERPAAPTRRRNVVAWVLALLLALALAGLLAESRRAAELSARVDGLSAELAASRASLEAHRRLLARVRTSLEAVEASVAELRSLVSQEPAPGRPEGPAAGSGAAPPPAP